MNKDPLRTKKWKLRELNRAKGHTYPIDLVSAEPARELIQHARQRGLTWMEIHRLTGVPELRLQRIGHGKVQRIQRQNERKILNGLGEPDARSVDPHQLVRVKKRHRQMVMSLAAQGWTFKHQRDIIKQNGKGSGQIVMVLSREKHGPRAQKRSLDQLLWLVEVIGDKRGPSRATKAMERKGISPLKHYYSDGRLNVNSLTPEQQRYVR